MTSVLPGDVVFFKATDSFLSRLIARFTSSEFTHVGLVVSYNLVNESVIIIEADRFIRTRLRELKFDSSLHALYRVPGLKEKQREGIVSFAFSRLGTEYDYPQIIGLFLRLVLKLNTGDLFNLSNRLICSELIDVSYYLHDVPRKTKTNIGDVSPQELLINYPLTLQNPILVTKDTQPL